VRIRAPLEDPNAVLGGFPGVERRKQAPSGYTLAISDPEIASPTLEPVLITPIRREEFLIAKALAAFFPTLVIAYMVFGIFLVAAALFAHPVIVSAIYAGTHLLVQLLFTPLLAGWGVWVGIAVSARSTDVRLAQQLSVLAWRVVAAMFDRERLSSPERALNARAELHTHLRSNNNTEPGMSPTVTLKRATGRVMELRRSRFEIVLDGNPAGSIDRDQTVELPVEPGPHTLQVRTGRYSSRAQSFDAADGTNIHFRCNGAVLWPQYVASLFAPTIGLKLKREQP
jgi:hypothetical protein